MLQFFYFYSSCGMLSSNVKPILWQWHQHHPQQHTIISSSSYNSKNSKSGSAMQYQVSCFQLCILDEGEHIVFHSLRVALSPTFHCSFYFLKFLCSCRNPNMRLPAVSDAVFASSGSEHKDIYMEAYIFFFSVHRKLKGYEFLLHIYQTTFINHTFTVVPAS